MVGTHNSPKDRKMKTFTAYLMTVVFVSCIVFIVCSPSAEAISCDSCGSECSSACGTRHFRTCCFNYLRKRSAPPMGPKITSSFYRKPFVFDNILDEISSGMWKHDSRDMLRFPLKLSEFDRIQFKPLNPEGNEKLTDEGDQHFVEST